jgi:hypothetical protein
MFLLDSLARSVGEAITQAPGFLNDNLTTLVVSSIVVTITVFLAKLFGADSSLDVEDAQDKAGGMRVVLRPSSPHPPAC